MEINFLLGKRVVLRPLVEADADGPYVGWFNDADVCRGNSHHVFPYSREGAREYIRSVNQAQDNLTLAIALREGGAHIGNVSLQDIHRTFRSAEFAIVIGDRNAWGKGFSKEAGRLLFEHGFKAMNLHRISCGTFANNLAMQRLALHLRMKEEGRRRQAAFKDGRYVDIVEYGVLKDEYLRTTHQHSAGENDQPDASVAA